MDTYLVFGKFTEQGIGQIKQTTQRAERFAEIAEGFGIRVVDVFWLQGEYDVVNIVETPDPQALHALLLRVGAWGNVRTTTCRAFNKNQMTEIISKMDAAK